MTSDNRPGGDNLYLVAGATALIVGVAAAYSCRPRNLVSSVTRDLEGATVLVTGGNSGIGKAVALNLGQRGARVLIGCRNLESARDVCDRLGNDKCHVFSVDLANASSVETFTESIRKDTTLTGLQLLINNAGAMFEEEDKSADGWDRSMAVNHTGWVQVTRNLLPVLEKTAANSTKPVRVVNVGSTLEKGAKIPNNPENSAEWDNWIKVPMHPYSLFPAYANAKMAMTAVTFHWANLLKEKKIDMMVVSPGMVNTSLPRFMPLWKRFISWPIRALLLRTPEKGAESILFAALSPDAETGDYIRDLKPIQRTDNCSAAAKNPAVQKQVWEATLRAIDARKQR